MTTPFDLGFQATPDEIILDQLPIEGEIPTWLEGTL